MHEDCTLKNISNMKPRREWTKESEIKTGSYEICTKLSKDMDRIVGMLWEE
jgi:hypothetical protein